MHYPMFSHAPEPVDQQHQHNGVERTVALYVESTLEPHEAWAALTEYILTSGGPGSSYRARKAI